MKAIKYFLISIVAITVLYLAGPISQKPILNQDLPKIEGSIENYVKAMENKPGIQIKPGCEAKILWANDSTKQPTELSCVQLLTANC